MAEGSCGNLIVGTSSARVLAEVTEWTFTTQQWCNVSGYCSTSSHRATCRVAEIVEVRPRGASVAGRGTRHYARGNARDIARNSFGVGHGCGHGVGHAEHEQGHLGKCFVGLSFDTLAFVGVVSLGKTLMAGTVSFPAGLLGVCRFAAMIPRFRG